MSEKQIPPQEKMSNYGRSILAVVGVIALSVIAVFGYLRLNSENNVNDQTAKVQVQSNLDKAATQVYNTYKKLDPDFKTLLIWYLAYAKDDMTAVIETGCKNFLNAQSSVENNSQNLQKCIDTLTIIFKDIKVYQNTNPKPEISILIKNISYDLVAKKYGTDSVELIQGYINAVKEAGTKEAKKTAAIAGAKGISTLVASNADIVKLNNYCDTQAAEENKNLCKVAVSLVEIYKGTGEFKGDVSALVIPEACSRYAPNVNPTKCQEIMTVVANNITEYYASYAQKTTLTEPFVVSVMTDIVNLESTTLTAEDVAQIVLSINAIKTYLNNAQYADAIKEAQKMAKQIATIVATPANIQKALDYCATIKKEKMDKVCILLAKSAVIFTGGEAIETINGDMLKEMCESKFPDAVNAEKCKKATGIIVEEALNWYEGGYSVSNKEAYLKSLVAEFYTAGVITNEDNYNQFLVIIDSADALYKAITSENKDAAAIKTTAVTLAKEIIKLGAINEVKIEDISKICEKTQNSKICKALAEATKTLKEYGISSKEDAKNVLITESCKKAFPNNAKRQEICGKSLQEIVVLTKNYYQNFDEEAASADKDENSNGVNDYYEKLIKDYLTGVANIIVKNIPTEEVQNFLISFQVALKAYNSGTEEEFNQAKADLKADSISLAKYLAAQPQAVALANKTCEKITDAATQEACKTLVLVLEIYQGAQNTNKSAEEIAAQTVKINEFITSVCSKKETQEDKDTCAKTLSAISAVAQIYYPEFKNSGLTLEAYLAGAGVSKKVEIFKGYSVTLSPATKKDEIIYTLAIELFKAGVITLEDLLEIAAATA